MSIYRYKFGTYKSKVAHGKKEAALPYMTDNINSNIMLDYNVYISRCLLVFPLATKYVLLESLNDFLGPPFAG